MAPNPQLIAAIRRQPSYLQVPLLTTALIESGGRLDAVGDNGHSYGPYQEYDQGRGAGLTPAQREDPVASTARAAREFAQFYAKGARGASLAYRAQRPADQSGYMARYNQLLPQARSLLGSPSPSPTPVAPRAAQAAAGGAVYGGLTPESQAAIRQYLAVTQAQAQAGQTPSDVLPLVQRVQIAQDAPAPASAQMAARAIRAAAGGSSNSGGRVLGEKSLKLIGTPYSGTHTLGNWESDDAVDISAPVGTPVYAVSSGTIGSQFGSLGEGGRFAGLRLHLQTPGNEWYYAHLSRFAPGIKPGAKVKRGQLLGYSGEANGVGHLHLGVEHGDPRTILGLR